MARAGVTLDVRVSQDNNTASGTIASGAFSTSSGSELLLAFVSADSTSSPNTTVKSVSGAGLSWALVKRANGQAGTAEIWRAFAPAALHGVTVAAQLSQNVQSSLTVMSFAGVDPAGGNGSGAIGGVAVGESNGGAPSASLVSTRNNSLIVGVGNDYDHAIGRVPLAGEAIVHQSLAAAGDTYWVQWQSAPVPLSGTRVTLGDSSPSMDQYNLSICEILPAPTANGAQVKANATRLDYGTVLEGHTVTQPLTLTSIGSSPVTISSAKITGAGFQLPAGDFPVTLAAGHSLTLQVSFDPQSAGAWAGQLSVGSNAVNTPTAIVQLSGAGTVAAPSPQLTFSPTSLSFGSVAVGGMASRTLTLTSTGGSPVTITDEEKAGFSFKLQGVQYPLTLSPGKTAAFQVVFRPTAASVTAGQVFVVSNAAKSTTAIAVSGTGVSSKHSVSLTWSPPGSSPVRVTGYNIYRALGSGSYSRLNASPGASASYTDATVASGAKYSYEVKSVAAGAESAPSNPITVAIPSP